MSAELLAEFERDVCAIARKLAGKFYNCDELCRDLEQEGRMFLWGWEEPTGAAKRKVYIRHAIRNQMIDYIRTLHPDRFSSLDELLDAGFEVDTNPYTGERRLSDPKAHQRGTRELNQVEDHLLQGLDARTILRALDPESKRLLRLCYGLTPVPGHTRHQPPTLAQIGQLFSGLVGEKKPISEAAVRFRRDNLLRDLRKALTHE